MLNMNNPKDVKEIKETMDFPEDVIVEPEYIINKDGSIKLTGFGLVRKERKNEENSNII